jgi:CAAX prenyl protease-like protein
MSDRRKLIAYTLPMALFLVLLALNGLLKKIDGAFWLSAAEYWIYPLQTVLCGVVLIWFWREYSWHRPTGIALGIAAGVVVFVLWISPQAFLGFPARTLGFNPDIFVLQPSLHWPTIALRFLRLVVVVPLLEEIFWRGFLLRYVIDEKFERVPFGTFSWRSFGIVTLLFALSHSKADWITALLAGAIFNGVAYRTKSLSTCVAAHATANLLLGLWIVRTKEWGFW